MTAIVLPDIDRSTLDELMKRMPDWSEIDLNLPSRKEVGKTADQAIDKLLGRSRRPVWPWVAAGVGLVAIAGVVAAWFAWFRKPAWQIETQYSPNEGHGLDAPAADDAWPATEPSLTGGIDSVEMQLDEQIGDAPTASAARATMVRGASGTLVEEA